MDCSMPGFPVLHHLPELLKFMSIESVMPANRFILCHPLLLLPSIIPSIRVFFNELPLRIRWPKYWSFSFSISPSNEYSGLIFFRIDWFDLLPVKGTLKSLLSRMWETDNSIIGALASVPRMNIQGWFPLELTGLISLQSKWLSRIFSKSQFKSINSSVLSLLYGPHLTSIHDYWKNNSFD